MTSETAGAPGRALDGIAYGLIGVVLSIYYPGGGAGIGGAVRYWHLLPVAWITVSVFHFTGGISDREGCRGLCLRLRFSGLCAVGFSPFVTWWLRCGDHPYLVIGTVFGVLSGVWFLIDLSSLLIVLSSHAGGGTGATDARIARMLLLYLLLIPILSLHVSFAAALLIMPGTVLADLERFWFLVPPLFRYLTVVPLLNLVRVCWQGAGRIWLQREGYAGDTPGVSGLDPASSHSGELT